MTYYKNELPYQGPKMGAEWYADHGYTTEAPVAAPAVKRYDQLKIIRALGDGWAAKRAELEVAGLLDKFLVAPYLSSADADFSVVLKTLTDDELALLDDECQREEG